MFKNLTKVFAFVLVLAVMVTSMASCEWPWGDKTPDVCKDHVDADGDKKCDKCGEDMGGCKSALTIGAIATMILAGAWVTIAARKKED